MMTHSKNNSNAPTSHTRGQATVELMIILPLLLIILAVSISIFAQQLLIADALRSQQAVERTAELVANALFYMHLSPIGSRSVFYIPSGMESQTIQTGNGFVEVISARGFATAQLPSTEWVTPALYDGNYFTVWKDVNGNIHTLGGVA